MKLYKQKDRIFLIAAMILGGINAALSAFISILLQQMIDVASGGNISGFTKLFFVMIVYLAVLGMIGFLEALIGKRLFRNTSIHLREEIFTGVMKKNPEDFSAENSADYLSALTNDVKLLEENFLMPLLLTVQMMILFITTLGILFFLSPAVTGILLFSLILMFLVPALLGKGLQKRQKVYSGQLAEFTACTKDALNGYEVVYDYQAFPYVFHKFRRSNRETADRKYAADTLLAVNEAFSDVFSSLSIVVIVFVSAYLLMRGEITMGTLLALIQLSGTFVTPIVVLMQNVPKITGMKPIIERLDALRKQNEEQSEVIADMLQPDFRELSCENLTFAYEPERPILRDITLSITAGKKYALLGESGGGKSTLIRLITGHMKNFRGDILYNEKSIADFSEGELTRMTAVIHQNVFLFNASIYENICLGQKYSDIELECALEQSGVMQFLPDLEKGLDTLAGENGQFLSGGQRQRIAIARALIQRTPLLFVDEGTSAVDRENAYEIEKTLLNNENVTVVVITHHMDEKLRPLYDRILTLRDGQISEEADYL